MIKLNIIYLNKKILNKINKIFTPLLTFRAYTLYYTLYFRAYSGKAVNKGVRNDQRVPTDSRSTDPCSPVTTVLL